MTYDLAFHEKALKEFRQLSGDVRSQLKKKLAERLENPHIPGAKLHGPGSRYKIKLMRPAIRLVYEVHDNEVVVVVLAVGKRERSDAYVKASSRHWKR